MVPWFLWPLVSRHANCEQKETFQAPTDLNSCLFSKGIIITSKPKWDFCVKGYSLVSCRIINSFASVRKCVEQLITMQRQRNRHYFKWIQSKFRGKEKFNLSLVKKKLPSRNFVQEQQRNLIEKRASSCTWSPFRVMFCFLKPTAWILLKLPNETNRTDKAPFLWPSWSLLD